MDPIKPPLSASQLVIYVPTWLKTIMLELTTGNQYQIRVYNEEALIVVPCYLEYDSLSNLYSSFIFGLQSIQQGTEILVNTLDPTSPIVSNDGVLSLASANAGLTFSASKGAIAATNTKCSLSRRWHQHLGGRSRIRYVRRERGSGGGGGTTTQLQIGPPPGTPNANGLSLALSYPLYTLYNNAVLQVTSGQGLSITSPATGGYRRIGFFQKLGAQLNFGSGTPQLASITGWSAITTSGTFNTPYWNTIDFAAGLPTGQVQIPPDRHLPYHSADHLEQRPRRVVFSRAGSRFKRATSLCHPQSGYRS